MNNTKQTVEQPKKWLPIGWKVMAGWGIFNAIFAVIVPITSLFISPSVFTFGVEDAKFVGMSWNEIAASSPHMGLWMVLMMVSMCSMHIGYSILTIYVAKRPYRNGERWAWHALAFSSLAMFFYSIVIAAYYVREGLYGVSTAIGFPSSVSIGVPFVVIMTVVFYIGLWLPRKELQKSEAQ
ncbi:hypothetical protein HY970_03835 [Candidatus Kaiserbacteria bacterium]|nr:hypothetical protein [Candidatus Kaiserbacteria bacterium]